MFPEKIEIIKHTEVGKNNHFLDAIKRAIKNYSKENPEFAKKYHKNINMNAIKKATPVVIGATIFSFCLKKIHDKFGAKKEKEQINKRWLV